MSTKISVTIDRDWHVGADGVSYPPEPWYLGGDAVVSAFAVPRDALPARSLDVIPHSARLVTIGGKAVVVAAFLHYTEGGVLQYEELLTAYAVISRHGVGVTIPQIWVTSANSRTGGRELWGIPKCLGEFSREVSGRVIHTSMALDGTDVATVDARLGRRLLPGTRQIPLPTAQILDGATTFSTNRLLARVRVARTEWTFDPGGPLGYLAGRTPLLSLGATDAAVLFGTRVCRS